MANIKKDFASPNGPILLLSAKGSTTASISQANGVKDFSGNENHGQAYNTVTIIEDSEHGPVFSFDTSTSYLGGINLDINNTTGMTYAYWINSSSFNVTSSWPQDIRHYSASTGSIVLGAMATEFFVDHYNSSGSRVWRYEISKSFALNTWHHFAIVISPASGTSIYHNGVLIGSNASKTLSVAGTSVPLTIKGAGTGRVCKMSDIRIYPRALSAAEVKYLYNGFQPNLSMGQKYPTKVMWGSREAERIYYGSNLIYINVSDYSDRPPVGTVKQVTTTPAKAETYQNGSALILHHGSVPGIVCTDWNGSKVMFFLPDGTRSSGTFNDYTHTNLVNPCYLCEDDEGYVYTTGGNSGYLFKLQPVVSGSTYSFNLVASLKLGSMVAANEVTYNAARSSLIVIGWDSGGGTSHCYQVPKTLASATSIARWSMPSLGGCMTLDGTKLFVGLYNSSAGSGIFTFSSASDTAEKTSRTTTIYPNSYSPKISGSSDSRFWIAANDGYMYWNMLNGTLYKYDTNGTYISTITTSVDSPRQDGSIVYDDKDNALTFVRTDGYAYKIYL